jgi:hypothetical protein
LLGVLFNQPVITTTEYFSKQLGYHEVTPTFRLTETSKN